MAVICFVVGAYVISWAMWWPLAYQGGAPADSAWRYLHLLGGFGPAIAGVMAVRLCDGERGVTRLVDRVGRWRVGLRWHAIAWLLPFVLLWIAVLAVRVSTGDREPVRFDRSAEYPHLPMALYWLASVTAYGFGEEIGWRGVLLPRLQSRLSALPATLLLSVIWAGSVSYTHLTLPTILRV